MVNLLPVHVEACLTSITAAFKVNVRGYTKDDDDMVCVDLAIDFRNRPFLGIW
jgi:hypothetical protein